MEHKLNAFYCCFAAWSKKTDLVMYDEFLFAENDTAARRDFEAKIAKKFGGNWHDELSKREIVIRNLTRVVRALELTNEHRQTTDANSNHHDANGTPSVSRQDGSAVS